MWFNLKAIDVWRNVPASGFVPSTYVYFTTVSGTVTDLSGSDAIRNNQQFADVKKLIFLDINYKNIIRSQDEVVIDDEWFRVVTTQKYENMLSHVEIYLGDSQWRRD